MIINRQLNINNNNNNIPPEPQNVNGIHALENPPNIDNRVPNRAASNRNPRIIPNQNQRNDPNMNNINNNRPANQNPTIHVTNEQLQNIIQQVRRLEQQQQQQQQPAEIVRNRINGNNNQNPIGRNNNQSIRMVFLRGMRDNANLLVNRTSVYPANLLNDVRELYGANRINFDDLQGEILRSDATLNRVRTADGVFNLCLVVIRAMRNIATGNHRAGCICNECAEERRVMGLLDRATTLYQYNLRVNENIRRIVVPFRNRCNRMINNNVGCQIL